MFRVLKSTLFTRSSLALFLVGTLFACGDINGGGSGPVSYSTPDATVTYDASASTQTETVWSDDDDYDYWSDDDDYAGDTIYAEADASVTQDTDASVTQDTDAGTDTPSACDSDSSCKGDRLKTNEKLVPGEYLMSENGNYKLVFQRYGALELLNSQGTILWQTPTKEQPVTYAIMEAAGDFAIYKSDGKKAWHTDTNNHVGSFLQVENDGKLTLYQENAALWFEGRAVKDATGEASIMKVGQKLLSGYELASPDGHVKLVLIKSNDLRLYHGNDFIWRTEEAGSPEFLTLEEDGNLVVYGYLDSNNERHVYWTSNTTGNTSSYLAVQNNGFVVLYQPRCPCWSAQEEISCGCKNPPN